MAKSDAQIAAILSGYGELTDAQALQLYRQVRDQILAKLFDDEAPKTVTIRARTFELPDPKETLKYVEQMIDYYQRKTTNAANGIARTYARLSR